jgi:predicted Zn-dependent peptidase
MEAVIAGAVQSPPSAEDLESAKRYLCGHFAMDHQTNGKLAWYLGFYEMIGKGWGYDVRYPEEIRKVTADDVHRVAERIFGRPPVVVRVRSSK